MLLYRIISAYITITIENGILLKTLEQIYAIYEGELKALLKIRYKERYKMCYIIYKKYGIIHKEGVSKVKNKIINDDCLKGMDKLIKKGILVDLIVADPPYCISKNSQFHTMKDRNNPRTGTDFGSWDIDFDNKFWLRRAFKILKDGGSLIVFNDFKKASHIIDMATALGFEYKDTLIWKKTNPMPRNRDRRYVPSLEMMIWFVKPKAKWTFNRLKETYESGVFEYASESGGGFKRIHPTQKPVKLIETIINIHSNEGEMVLDPFMGSGTTAIASINTGRTYIGFELESDYFEKSIKRISELSKDNEV